MAKLIWALLCRRIIVDQQPNSVSYIDAIEGLVGVRPRPAPLVAVATLWQRGGEIKLEMRVTVFSPAGDSVIVAEAESLTFEPQHTRGRMHLGLTGFPLAGPGQY